MISTGTIVRNTLRRFRTLVEDPRAASSTELAVVLALVILGALLAVSALGGKISSIFSESESAITAAPADSGNGSGGAENSGLGGRQGPTFTFRQ